MSGNPFLPPKPKTASSRSANDAAVSVLNLLEVNVSIVNSEGVIIAVDDAWLRFGADNGGNSDSFGVGVNYFEVCRKAQGAASAEAALMLAGMKKVLGGELPFFELEYPCSSPEEMRFFLARVTPLAGMDGRSLVVSHINITEHKVTEATLRASDSRFRLLVDNAQDTIYRLRLVPSPTFDYLSPSVEGLTGYAPQSFYEQPDLYRQLLHPADRHLYEEALAGRLPSGTLTLRYRHRAGHTVWTEQHTTAVRLGEQVVALEGIVRDVTERKRMVEELMALKERLNFLLSATPVIILTLAPTAPFLPTFVSDNICCSLAYDPDDVCNKLECWQQHWHPEDVATAQAVLREVVATGEGDMTLRLHNAQGEERWFYHALRLVRNAQGEALEIVGYALDITERKRTEAALQESETQLRGIIENANEGICLKDADGRYLLMNPAGAQLLGQPRENFIGRRSDEVLSPDVSARIAAADAEVRRTLEPHVYENRFVIDGQERILLTSKVPYLSPEGIKTIGISRDISERKRNEETLQREKERLIKTLELARAYSWCMELNGANPQQIDKLDVLGPIEAILGSDWRERVGSSFETFFATVHPDDREGFQAKWAAALRTGEPTMHVFRVEKPAGGWLWLRQRWAALGNTLEGFTLDVTEVVETQVQAEAAERANAAKSEFLSLMSHEFRTPLTVILGFAELLEMGDLDSNQRRSVADIYKAGQHLLGLVNDTLDIARIESGNLSLLLEPIDVSALMQEMMSLAAPLARARRIGLSSEVAVTDRSTVTYSPGMTDSVTILADYNRLKQVLLNLVSNAMKYNHENGTVLLKLEERGNNVRLSVRDNGLGIAPDLQARLFTPFDRLGAEASEVEGSGIGLALSKRLTEAMGGRIGVKSAPGQGSTFWLDFARSTLSSSVSTPPEALPEALMGASRRILYIEDNRMNLRLVESIFTLKTKLQLFSAPSGITGLELAHKEQPDLILLDLRLPDIGGEEVFQRLQADPRTARIPVIIVSANAMPEGVQSLLDAGVYAYLTKPLQLPLFLRTVAEALERPD